jgi:haloalkane dehalogenase
VQDWAGPIGLGFAGWRPDLISELIICNTWAWPAQGIKHFENWSRLTGGGLGRFLIVRFNAFTGLLVPMSMNRKLTRAERAAYAKPYPTPASRIPHSQFAGEAGLARLRDKPVLILWGDRDPGFRESERRRFEIEFPDAEIHVLHGAKHFVQEDAPAEICEAIQRFETSTADRRDRVQRVDQ